MPDQPAPALPCDKCRKLKSDVRLDNHTGLVLCDACWFHTDPRREGPKNEARHAR